MTAGRRKRPRLGGTGRFDAFSDGVFAIVVTLLVLELRLPVVEGHSNEAFLAAFGTVAPKFLSFMVSGSSAFLAAALLGFILPPAVIAIFVIIPITFVVPALLGADG